jgi:hypothetical protein
LTHRASDPTEYLAEPLRKSFIPKVASGNFSINPVLGLKGRIIAANRM